MKKNLVIYGTGQTADIIYNYFKYDSDYHIIAFVDEKKFIKKNKKFNLPVVESSQIEKTFDKKKCFFFIAISYQNLNLLRSKKYAEIKKKGYKFASYIHSKLNIIPEIEIGNNCFISENVSIQPFAKIKNNVFLWSNSVIGHHTIIENHCWITSNSTIGGNSQIGKNTFLGINSMIGHMVKIGNNNFIGSGSIINNSTKNNSVYIESQTKKYILNSNSFLEITKFK